jgi:hypothetical protein
MASPRGDGLQLSNDSHGTLGLSTSLNLRGEAEDLRRVRIEIVAITQRIRDAIKPCVR